MTYNLLGVSKQGSQGSKKQGGVKKTRSGVKKTTVPFQK